MSIASRINEIGVHLTKDWRSIEALTGEAEVDKNIENIATVLDNLWEEMPKVTGTGTSLSLATKSGKMKVNLLGNTSQYTTTGKNLINVSNANFGSGSITLFSGSITAPATISFDASISSIPNVGGSLFVATVNGSSTYITPPILKKSNGQTLGETPTTPINDRLSYTISSGTITSIRLVNWSNIVGNYSNMMLELSSTPTTYEPYTGGIASPNPTYPQDVHIVSGDNEVVVCGKNLLGLTNGTYSNNGITAIVNNGEITLSGTASGTSFVSIPLLQDIVLLNQTITLSANNISTGGDSLTEIRVYTSGSSYLACTYNTIDNSVVYTNKTDTYNRVQIRTSSGVSYNNLVLKPMLEKSNSHTTYEPYQSSTYPIHLGEYELCKIGTYQDRFIRNSGKNLSPNNEISNLLSYANSVRSTSTGQEKLWWDNINNLPKDTQIIGSWEYTGNGTEIANITGKRITIYYTDGTNQLAEKGNPFTIPSSKTIDYIYVYGGQSTTSNKWYNIMFNLGTTALPYEPYGTNEWYLEKKIRHLSLAIADMNNNEDYPGWKNVPYIIEDLQGQGYIENLTSFKSNITDKKSSIAVTTYSSILYLDKNYGFGLTQTQWKTNYPNLVFELYYGLQTSIYTPITGTLKDELEAVWRANSYKGQTNINQVNNDLPFELDVSALEE